MSRLGKKLIELGYEEMALCWRKENSYRMYIIFSKDLKLNYILNEMPIKSQQDIDNLQQAFNTLQNDLKELKDE
jgi:muconolactone delta-isomerase